MFSPTMAPRFWSSPAQAWQPRAVSGKRLRQDLADVCQDPACPTGARDAKPVSGGFAVSAVRQDPACPTGARDAKPVPGGFAVSPYTAEAPAGPVRTAGSRQAALRGAMAGLLWAMVAGCGPAAAPAPRALLLYCTPAVEAQARILKRVIEQDGVWQVVLAPMTGADLMSALEGLKTGDFAVFAGSRLRDQLAERKLLRGEPVGYPLSVGAVAARPLELADLGKPGLRLGGGGKDGDLTAAVGRVLPADLGRLVEANTRQRSERSEELLRLVRLGALDAAFVWDTPPPTDLRRLRLPPDPLPCSLQLVALSCSRLSQADSAALLATLRDEPVRRALRGEGKRQEATTP